MKKFNLNKSFSLLLIAALVLAGCTKLDETTYTDITQDNFYNNRREVLQAALRPFTHMQA